MRPDEELALLPTDEQIHLRVVGEIVAVKQNAGCSEVFQCELKCLYAGVSVVDAKDAANLLTLRRLLLNFSI